MRICMMEVCENGDEGAIGASYVVSAARAAGFAVDVVRPGEHAGYDVEMVSVHHCSDFPRLARIPQLAPIRLGGGHPTTNNIRPVIHLADAWCIGEGESWIVEALTAIRDGGDLSAVPGTLMRDRHEPGGQIPAPRVETPMPKNPPYLNRSEGGSPIWYLELSRGCPFSCHYCELGHSSPYRHQDTDWLLDQVDGIDASVTRHVTLFAPDEASHPGYHRVLQRIHDRGLITQFGSMRLDVIMRREGTGKELPFKPNMLIRVGLDGLTAETRFRVNRKIKTEDVVRYFRWMSDRGHYAFKIFCVFGYPWEKLSDFDEFEAMMAEVTSIRRRSRKGAQIRLKFTPLIPQPITPLAGASAKYDVAMVHRIRAWMEQHRYLRRPDGWAIKSDQVMSKRTWEEQCRLTAGDEHALSG